jgi:hypothetical protein
MEKFGCCDTCVHFEDGTVCHECDDAEHFEVDESLIGIGENGYPYIRLREVA